MVIGTIAAIWRYPVKSLAGESLSETELDACGVPGDRARAMIVKTPDHAREGKPYRGKENDRLHLTSELEVAVECAKERNVAVEVARDDEERFYDAAPLSLILDRWLDGLSAHVGRAVEHQRFRPNIFVATAGEVSDENGFVDRELHLGSCLVRVRKPIGRCVVTTYDLAGGPSDPRVLRYVAQERANIMGIYCDILRGGVVRVGDPLALAAGTNA